MSKYVKVPLQTHIPRHASLTFLHAEVPTDYHNPFAQVYYTQGGHKGSLRLDLGRQAFIDHFDDEALEETLRAATQPIIEAILAKDIDYDP